LNGLNQLFVYADNVDLIGDYICTTKQHRRLSRNVRWDRSTGKHR